MFTCSLQNGESLWDHLPEEIKHIIYRMSYRMKDPIRMKFNEFFKRESNPCTVCGSFLNMKGRLTENGNVKQLRRLTHFDLMPNVLILSLSIATTQYHYDCVQEHITQASKIRLQRFRTDEPRPRRKRYVTPFSFFSIDFITSLG